VFTPSRGTNWRIAEQSEERGRVCNECEKGRVRTEAEVAGAAREVITRSPIEVCSVWRNRLESQSELHGKSVVMACICFHTG
jgi:hypothetical protein